MSGKGGREGQSHYSKKIIGAVIETNEIVQQRTEIETGEEIVMTTSMAEILGIAIEKMNDLEAQPIGGGTTPTKGNPRSVIKTRKTTTHEYREEEVPPIPIPRLSNERSQTTHLYHQCPT